MEQEDWFDRLVRIQSELGRDRWEYWQEYVLFSFNWWLLILYFIIGWVLWWMLADRKRLMELFVLGGTILVLALKLDMIGAELGLWDYLVMVLPWGSRLVIVDAVMPIFYMLVYQYTRSMKSYYVGVTLLSLLFAFVLEPLMVNVGVYRPLYWEHMFSVPGYIAIGLLARWFTVWVMAVIRRQQRTANDSIA